MMRNLEFPKSIMSPMTALRTALGSNRALTPQEEKGLRAAFKSYDAAGGRGNMIQPIPQFQQAASNDFYNAYAQTYEKRRLFALRTKIKAIAGNRCPRCGGSRPGTLDHHLPRSIYAEFAVHPKNLLACCNECNQKKSAIVGSSLEETFLHPYYDRLPEVPFISVTLKGGRSFRARVTFDDNAKIADPVLKARMKNQFQKVDVNARIASELEEFLAEAASDIAYTLISPSKEHVAALLQQRAHKTDNQYGICSWQSAVLRALSGSDEFCNGGYSKVLPKKLT